MQEPALMMWSQVGKLNWQQFSCTTHTLKLRSKSDWLRRTPALSEAKDARVLRQCMDWCRRGTTARPGAHSSSSRGDAFRFRAALKLLLFYAFVIYLFLLLFFWHTSLQVQCDVLAARCETPLTNKSAATADTSSEEWWVLSWPGREVSILRANCQRGDASGMTRPGRAREVAAGTSCLPPWCLDPTSFQGCCGKQTAARMSGGWRGSGRSRGFCGRRRWSKQAKCSNCWERSLFLIVYALSFWLCLKVCYWRKKPGLIVSSQTETSLILNLKRILFRYHVWNECACVWTAHKTPRALFTCNSSPVLDLIKRALSDCFSASIKWYSKYPV